MIRRHRKPSAPAQMYEHNGVKMSARQWAKCYIARLAAKHRDEFIKVMKKYPDDAAHEITKQFDYITTIVSERRNFSMMNGEQERVLAALVRHIRETQGKPLESMGDE